MHPGAFEFVGRYGTADPIAVIEIGSRDINGSVRCHFSNARWFGLDLWTGTNVDLVADALQYNTEPIFDLVVICEVMEHCPRWREMIIHAATWLKPDGRIIITCAGPGRDPHSANDGGGLRPGEHYSNISQQELRDALEFAAFDHIEVSGNEYWKDTYAIAVKV